MRHISRQSEESFQTGSFARVLAVPERGGLTGLFGVVSPLAHGIAHGQQLTLEARTGLAGDEVQPQRQPVVPGQAAVFPCDQQLGGLLAGTAQDHHVFSDRLRPGQTS